MARRRTIHRLAKMTRLAYLQDAVREAHGDLDACREHERWRELAALWRVVLDIRDKLDLTPDESAKGDDRSDAEVMADLVAMVGGLGPGHLDTLYEAVVARHGAPPLRVVGDNE